MAAPPEGFGLSHGVRENGLNGDAEAIMRKPHRATTAENQARAQVCLLIRYVDAHLLSTNRGEGVTEVYTPGVPRK